MDWTTTSWVFALGIGRSFRWPDWASTPNHDHSFVCSSGNQNAKCNRQQQMWRTSAFNHFSWQTSRLWRGNSVWGRVESERLIGYCDTGYVDLADCKCAEVTFHLISFHGLSHTLEDFRQYVIQLTLSAICPATVIELTRYPRSDDMIMQSMSWCTGLSSWPKIVDRTSPSLLGSPCVFWHHLASEFLVKIFLQSSFALLSQTHTSCTHCQTTPTAIK